MRPLTERPPAITGLSARGAVKLPLVVGLCGKAGAGKSFLAHQMVMHGGFCVRSFAAPLKKALKAMGVPPHFLDEPLLKKHSVPLFGGKSARELMQTLGTEWGRRMVSENLWVDLAEVAVSNMVTPVVFDDLRFENEARMVRNLGGVVVEVTGSIPATSGATGGIEGHESEAGVEADFEIENTPLTEEERAQGIPATRFLYERLLREYDIHISL